MSEKNFTHCPFCMSPLPGLPSSGESVFDECIAEDHSYELRKAGLNTREYINLPNIPITIGGFTSRGAITPWHEVYFFYNSKSSVSHLIDWSDSGTIIDKIKVEPNFDYFTNEELMILIHKINNIVKVYINF